MALPRGFPTRAGLSVRWVRGQREGGGENSETKPGRLCGVGARSEARSPGAEAWGEGTLLSVVGDTGCGPPVSVCRTGWGPTIHGTQW